MQTRLKAQPRLRLAAISVSVLMLMGGMTPGWAQGAPYQEPGKLGDPQSWRTPEFLKEWGLDAMHTEYAYAAGFTGKNISVGILDSGFYNQHPELSGNRFVPVEASGVTGALNDMNDTHGTRVTGVIGAARDGTGMHGVTPDAKIFVGNTNATDGFLFGVSDPAFPKSDAKYITAVYDALERAGVRVISNSWGSQPRPAENYSTLATLTGAYRSHEAVRMKTGQGTWLDGAAKVSRDGVINNFSAGNTGYGNASLRSSYPYFHPELEGHWMTTTGYDQLVGQVYNQCGIAKWWCVMAPTGVQSTSWSGTSVANAQPTYDGFNGTSAAAPHASAALALIMERFPYMTNDQALSVLFTTAQNMVPAPNRKKYHDAANGVYSVLPAMPGTASAPNTFGGWGLVDLRKAMSGPGQLLGPMNVTLPAGVGDTWSNDISDEALKARKTEDATEHAAWLSTLQVKGWANGLPSNASDADKVDYAIGTAREEAYQARVYEGSLIKSGDGSLTLAGTNTYRGPTIVNAGMLQIDGSIASAATVNGGVLKVSASGTTADVTLNGGLASLDGHSGAVQVNDRGLLMGNGTLQSLGVGTGGTVAPGHSIGALNVAGDVSFAPGSSYAVEVSPTGVSDQIKAAGKATLSGGTVKVSLENSPSLLSQKEVQTLLGQRYSILSAAGGVTGQFEGVLPNYLFIGTALSQDNNGVTLGIQRNAVSLASVAATQNQLSAAAAIESIGAGKSVYESLMATSTASDAQFAFKQLSGEIYPAMTGALINESRRLRESTLGRLSQTGDARESGAWMQVLGAWGSTNGDGNADGYRSSTGGFLAGADAALQDNLRVGVTAGYSRTSVGSVQLSSGAIDSYQLGAYIGQQSGPLGLRAGAAYALHSADVSRGVQYGGMSDTNKATLNAGSLQLYGEAGYQVLKTDATTVEPFANLALVHLRTRGFTEDGGGTALSSAGDNTNLSFSTLGARAATRFALTPTQQLALRATLGWQHALGGTTPQSTLAFVAGGSAFTVAGVPIACNAAVVDLSASVISHGNVSLTFSYTGLLASSMQDHTVKGNLNWKF